MNKVVYELAVRKYTQYGFFLWDIETFDNRDALLERVLEWQDRGYDDQIQITRKIEQQMFFGYIDDVFTEK